jgi:hypothetical protein
MDMYVYYIITEKDRGMDLHMMKNMNLDMKMNMSMYINKKIYIDNVCTYIYSLVHVHR